ncbi:RsmB/NOP family class I SAM-dependent RNA methyltransferase [Hydrogenophilus thiooxidans]|uniref:RsmB/NOP family class I SAM-dependent RNA methyltransferase n=1 Tax=Hydrogenophilus thiooxidans TaxID=2820326 RepID=UPI001C225AF2|nr:RsmB/NOP family class I SAM-dependent RNA methyltransferase [Hydrogenophilus thiooxidans]
MPAWVSFPEPLAPFVARLEALAEALVLPEAVRAAWFGSFCAPQPLAGRINPLRAAQRKGAADDAPIAQTAATFALPIRPAFAANAPLPHPLAAWSFVAEPQARATLTHSAPFRDGLLTVQSLSSQWAVWLLDPQPDTEILDLAAAPGGKTALIAAAIANRGRIAAVEAVKPRFFKLRAELARLGVTCAQTYLADGRTIGAKTPQRFARVLLDAPCSSEARIRFADPETWRHWKPRKVREAAHKQKLLLRAAWQALAPGGTLVYSTCSYAPEENEWVVAELLAEAPEAEVVPPRWSPPTALPGLTPDAIPSALTPRHPPQLSAERAAQLAHTRRVLPRDGFSGFFAARLFKRR